MLKIPFYIPIPDFAAVLALTPILLCRKIKYGFSFMRIKLTRGKYAIVDAKDYLKLYMFKWYAKKCFDTFYAVRTVFENGRKRHILMHRQIMDPAEGIFIDHKNHIGLDNRRSNLREATHAQNNYNRRKIIGAGSSIYKGVMFKNDHNKFYASIKVDGCKIFLGYFDSEIEAAKAYDEAAILYHGEFASLNFPSSSKPPAWSLPREIRSYLSGASLNFGSSAPMSQRYKAIFGL